MSLSRRMKKAAFRANMKAAANKNSVNNTHINEEPELGQEDSFLANMLGMISHSPFMKKVLLNAVGLTLMATSAGYGGITAVDGTQTRVVYDDNKYKITTHSDQIRSGTALNAFKEFSVEAGKIANIYYEYGVSNIVNFVGPQINIQGVVNTIRNTGTYSAPDGNRVGGRLFFLSSNGMVLGTAGVVNTGSFYAIVPNATYMQQFLTGDLSNPTGATTGVKEFKYAPGETFINQIDNITGGLIINGYNDDGANNGITLNPQGSIQIQGKINANNIGLYARNTTNYGISITGVDEFDKAELKTYKMADFASIVNTTNNASGYIADATTFAENDGEIRIVALGKGDAVTGITSNNAEIKTAGNGGVTILSEGKANLGAIAGKDVDIEANQGIELNGITAYDNTYDNTSITVKNTGASTRANSSLNKNGGAAGNIIVKGAITATKVANIEIINDAAASDGNGSIQLGKVTGSKFENATFHGKNVTLTAKNNITDTSHASYPDTPNIIAAISQIKITATNGNVSLTNMSYSSPAEQHAYLTVNAGGSATLKNLVGRTVSVTAKKGIDVNQVISKVESTDTANAINIVNEGAGATGDIVLKGSLEVNGNDYGTHNINVENKATASDGNGNIYLGELSEDDLVYASLSGKNITIKATNTIVDRDHGQTETQNKIKSTDVGSGDWNGISLTATNGDLSITNTQFLKSDVEGKTYAQLALTTGGKATLNDMVGKTVSVTAKKGIEVNNVQSTRLANGDVNEISLKNTGSGATGNIILKGTITADGYDNTNVIAGAGDILIQNDATANGDNGNIQIGEEGIDDLVKAEIIGKNVTLKASNAIADTQNATTPTTKNLIKSNTNISLTATKGAATITNTEFDTTDTAEQTKNYANLMVNTGDKATVKNLVGRNVTVNAKAGADIDGVTAKGYKTIVSETVTGVVDGTIAITNIEDSTGNIVLKGDIIANGKNGNNVATELSAGNGVITVENKAAASDGNGNIQIGKVEDTELVEAEITAKNITMIAKNGVFDKATESSTNKNLIQSAGKVNITANASDVQIQNTQFGADENPVYAEITVDAKGGKAILDNFVGKTVEITAKKGVEVNGIKSTTLVNNTQEEVKYEIKVLNTNSATGDIVLKGVISANDGVEQGGIGKGDILIQNDSTVSNEGKIQIGKVEDSELLNAQITGRNVYMVAQNGILDAASEASTNKNAINTDGTVVMEAKTGTITLGNTKVNAEKVEVEGNLKIIADKKAIEIANLEVNSNLAVTTPVESITVNNVVAKGNLTVDSHTTASLTDVTARTADVVANKGIVLDGVKTTGIEDNDVELRVSNTGQYASGDIIIKGTISANDESGVGTVYGAGDILIQNDAEINKEELGQHGNIYIGTKEDQVTTTATINGENVKLQAKDKITDAGDFDSNKLNAINSKGTVEMIAGTLVEPATAETPATYKNGEIELDNTKFGTTVANPAITDDYGDFALTAGEKVTLNNLTDLTEDVYVEKLNGVVETTNSKQAIVKSLTLNTTSKEATVNNVKTTGDLIVNSGKDALLDTVTAKTATITSAKGAKLHDVTTTGLKDVVPPAEIAYEISVHNTETGNIELTGNISANNQAAVLLDDPKYGDILIQNSAEGTTETNGNVLIGVEGESMTPVAITGADVVLKANNTVIDAGDKDSENKNTIKSKGTVEFVAGKVVVGPEPSIEGGNITIDNTEVDTTDAENPEYGEFVLKAGEGVTLTDVTQKVDELAVIAKTATIDKVKVKGGEGHVSVNAGETATITNVEADGTVAVYTKDGDVTISDLTSKASKVYEHNGPIGEITIGLGVNAGGKATLNNTTSKFATVIAKKGAELNNVTTTGLFGSLDLAEQEHIPEAEITIKNTSYPAPEAPEEATGNIVLKGVITADNGENVGKGNIYIKNAALAGVEDAENGNIVLGKETEGDEPEFTPVTIKGKNIVLDASNNLTDIGKATGIEKGNAIKSAEGEITMLTAGGSVVLDNTTLNNPTSDLVVNANKIEAIDDITAKSVDSVTKNGAVFNNVKTVTVNDAEGVKEIRIENTSNLVPEEATGNIVLKGVITADNGENVGKGDIYIKNFAPAGEASVEDAENGNIVLGAVTGEEPVFENVTINGKTVAIDAANNVIDENEVEEKTVKKNVINSDVSVAINAGGDINLDNTDFGTNGKFTLNAGNDVKLSNAVANVNTLVVTANNNAELADVEASGDLSVTATTQKASLDNVTAKTAFVVANTGIELKDVTTNGVNIPNATPIDVPSAAVVPFTVNLGDYAIAAVNGAAGGDGNIFLKGKIEAKNDGYDPDTPGSKEYSNIIVENLALAHQVEEPAVTDYENGNIILHGEEVAGEGENPATYNPVTISGENIIMYAKNDVADVVMSGDEVVENSEYKNVIKSKAKSNPDADAPTHVYVEAGQDLILNNTDFDTTDTHELDPENANDAIAHGDFKLVARRDASLSNNVSKADNVAVSALKHDANLTDVDVTGDLTVFADHKADLDTINANTVAVKTSSLEMPADDEAGVYINNLTSDGLRVLDINYNNEVDNGDATIGLGVMTAGKAVLTNTTSKIATVKANNGVELSNVTTTGLISDLEDATPEKTYAPEAEISVLNQNNGDIVLKDSVAANNEAYDPAAENPAPQYGNITITNDGDGIVLGKLEDEVLTPVTVDGNNITMKASGDITDEGNGESEEANAINAKGNVALTATGGKVEFDNTDLTAKNDTDAENVTYGNLNVTAGTDVTMIKSTEAGVTRISAGNNATISNLISKATVLENNPDDEIGLVVTAGKAATLTDVTAKLAKIQSVNGTTATRLTTTAVSEVEGVDSSINILNTGDGNITLIDSVAANNVIPATAETEETTVVGAGNITIQNNSGDIVIGQLEDEVLTPVTVDGNNITMAAFGDITDAGNDESAKSNAINAKGNVVLAATGEVELDNTVLTAKDETDAENVTYGNLNVTAGTDVTMTKSTEAGVTIIEAGNDVTISNLISKATLLTPNAEEPTDEIGLNVTADGKAELTDVTAKLAMIESGEGATVTRLTTTAVSEVEGVDSINIANNDSGNIVLIDSVAANNEAYDPAAENPAPQYGNITITNDGDGIVLGKLEDNVLTTVTVGGNNIGMEASGDITDAGNDESAESNAINAKGNVSVMSDSDVTLDNTTTVAVGNVEVGAPDVEIDDVTADTVVVFADGDATVSNVTSEGSRLEEEAFDYNGDEVDDDITIGMAVVAGGKATVSDTTSKFAAIMAAGGAELNNVVTTGVKGEEDALPEYNEKTYELAVLNRGEAVNDVLVKGEINANEGNLLIANESGKVVIGAVEEEPAAFNAAAISGANISITASTNVEDANDDEASNSIVAGESLEIAAAKDVVLNNTVINSPNAVLTMTANTITDAKSITASKAAITAHDGIALADVTTSAADENDPEITYELDIQNLGTSEDPATGNIVVTGKLNAGSGDIRILNNAEADEENGNVTLEDVEGNNVGIEAEGDVAANDITATEGDVDVIATNVDVNDVAAGTDVTMLAEGDLTANDVAAGNDAIMSSTGDLTAKDVTATTGTAELNAANATVEDVSATSVEIATTGDLSAKDIAATAGNVGVDAGNDANIDNINASADVTVNAGNNFNLTGKMKAGGKTNVKAKNVANNSINSTGDVVVEGDTVGINNVESESNININSQSDANIGNAVAGNDLNVTVEDGDLNAGKLQGDNIKTTLNSEDGVADVDTYIVGSSLDSSAANTTIGKIEQLDPNSPIDVKFSGVNGSDEYNAEVKNIIYNPGADMEGEVAYKDKEGNVQVLGPDGIIDVYNKVPKFDQAAREIYMLRPGMEMENTASKVDYKDANKFVLLFTRIKEYIRNSVVAITSGLLAKQEDNSNKQQSQEHKKLNLMDAYGAHEKFVENEGVELIERDFGDSSEGEEVAKHSISVNSKGEPIIR